MCELTWLLCCCVGKGLLERAHSYKDKVARGLEASMGLFNYPVLMAADISIYQSTLVPVGKNQQQHVEMAQDMAQSFNAAFGSEVFARPEWHFSRVPVGAWARRREDEQELRQHHPDLLPPEMTDKQAWKTVLRVHQDRQQRCRRSQRSERRADDALSLARRGEGRRVRADLYRGGVGYGELKKRLHEAYNERFGPLRERRQAILADEAYVEGVLEEGMRRARAVARETMERAREAAGIVVAKATHG